MTLYTNHCPYLEPEMGNFELQLFPHLFDPILKAMPQQLFPHALQHCQV